MRTLVFRTLATWVTFATLTFSAGAASKKQGSAHEKSGPAKPADPKQIEEMVRLQIFLDNAHFGPGKIDGRGGEFTNKALALYRESQGQPAAAPADPKSAPDMSGLDLQSIEPVFIDYQVTKDDLASTGPLPSSPPEQAKVKVLPYATVAEAVAEKFHADAGFIKELNRAAKGDFKEGDTLKVPNVKPFDLAAVKTIKPGAEIETLTGNDLGEDAAQSEKPAKKPAQSKQKSEDKSSPPPVALHISVKDEMLTVRAEEKLVAAFPVTVGSQQTTSPVGQWTVKAIAKMPNFRWDLAMLKHGERSSNSHLLPPGPNNPVGVMWIALNKRGIGIHGTNDPDSIGRSASHGCVRLANWDVVKLATMVKPGVPVTIE
jgi:lipoprotein-anchoring transpeptidase ErfK/SrfK